MTEQRGLLRWDMNDEGAGNASLLLGDGLHETDDYVFTFDSLDDLEPGMAHVIRSDGRQVGEAAWPPVS